MRTTITIKGTDFYINGKLTYHGRYHRGRRVEGLLFNSRMVQALFDDENRNTASNWIYPDTKIWNPNRNTNEFCDALSIYRNYGLLGVTVGLQGGGPNYSPEIYNAYINSAFKWNGDLKKDYFDRLQKILEHADKLGMIVILNFFYWQQNLRFENENAIRNATQLAAIWIAESGFKNVMIDINNEVKPGNGILESEGIHELIRIIRDVKIDGWRLPVGTSIHPWNLHPPGLWSKEVDFFLPHGNDSPGEKLRMDIRALKKTKDYNENPRPIVINEDSIDIKNLDIAVDEGVSWGFYSQGFGSNYRDFRWDWTLHEREENYEKLSGFQTPPINWQINTDFKKMFFNRVKTITRS